MLLARLIDDLGQLAVAEAGAMQLQLAPVDVVDALERAATAIRSQAAGRGVEVEVGASPGLRVVADAARLGQMLRNLLANAMIHTPPGGSITLAARAEGAHVASEVRDTGSGIAPDHLPHVFERFYRADPSRSRSTGGAGLGLSIVRHLAIAQGGEVTAESGGGGGTTLRFTLPKA